MLLKIQGYKGKLTHNGIHLCMQYEVNERFPFGQGNKHNIPTYHTELILKIKSIPGKSKLAIHDKMSLILGGQGFRALGTISSIPVGGCVIL